VTIVNSENGAVFWYDIGMNKRHRIFIAINLPQDIKEHLAKYHNLHITLVFVGDVTDEELGEVCMAVKEVVKNHAVFDMSLTKISYGPDSKIPPRYIWCGGEPSKELSALRNDVQDALLEKVHFTPEVKLFTPHITLARINGWEWRAIEPEERPEVDRAIDLVFTVESIEVMESELKREGPQYTVIESHQLT
jgi:2'-5' RNA ligase